LPSQIKYRFLRKAAKVFLQKFGDDLPPTFWYKLLPPDGREYGSVFPLARYRPWVKDSEFLATFDAIRDHTLADLYRCWELWTLTEQSAKLDRGAILEVGAWRGGTAALLAKRAAKLGIGPVYICDTFAGVVKAGPRDLGYRGGEHADTTLESVRALLRSLGVEQNAEILAGIFPEETAHRIEPEAVFRLCHIDVDVYNSGLDVLNWVWPRMVAGGLVVFDDYGHTDCEGIRKLVDEYAGNSDRLFVHNLNGHAIFVKS
jgi:O-methyltransferase